MKASIIPILKNRNGDSSDKNNYGPIAIVTAMSKLFELCLSKLLDTFLVTSDNQFDFKRKHPTDLCIYTVKSVIKYYCCEVSIWITSVSVPYRSVTR